MPIHMEPPRTKFDLNWSMLGVPVRLSVYFWLASLLLGWHKDVTLAQLAVWTGCVFFSILVHEFGHALTARAFGAYGPRVVLYHLGGLAIHETRLPPGRRIIELLMGPGAGFVLGGLVYAISFAVDMDAAFLYHDSRAVWRLNVWRAYQYLIYINFIWGLVNLIPVFPLDGGQIAKTLLVVRNPRGGAIAAHTLSIVAAIAAAAGFLAWGLMRDGRLDLFPVLMFGVLAYENYRFREHLKRYGDEEEEAPRQPWEQDPDWWKRGGR